MAKIKVTKKRITVIFTKDYANSKEGQEFVAGRELAYALVAAGVAKYKPAEDGDIIPPPPPVNDTPEFTPLTDEQIEALGAE